MGAIPQPRDVLGKWTPKEHPESTMELLSVRAEVNEYELIRDDTARLVKAATDRPDEVDEIAALVIDAIDERAFSQNMLPQRAAMHAAELDLVHAVEDLQANITAGTVSSLSEAFAHYRARAAEVLGLQPPAPTVPAPPPMKSMREIALHEPSSFDRDDPFGLGPD